MQILPRQSGTGKNGPWVKQDFIIETPGDYPKKVCVSSWGEKADEVSEFKEGDEMKININIESREYNERWYTDIKAWKIERNSTAGHDSPPSYSDDEIPQPSDDDDLLPF